MAKSGGDLLMAGLAEAMQGAVGQPASVRIGTVDSTSPLVVSAQGVVFDGVGVLGGYVPVAGDAVLLLGQSSGVGSDPASWVVLGAVRSIPSPVARLLQTGSPQSIPNGTPTALTFDTVDIDTAGGWDSTLPTRWTAPVAGYYQISGGVSWLANAAGGRAIRVRINGVNHAGSSVSTPGTAAIDLRMPVRTVQALLNAGDYVELFVDQDTGGPLNVAIAGTWEPSMEVRLI
jgi:hypothetical protein